MQILRLLKILSVYIRFGLHEITLPHLKNRRLRLLGYIFAFGRTYHQNLGIRIRLACEKLGPIFIKFGQALSTRLDLISIDIAQELTKLQDQVPPFSTEISIEIIEQSLNKKINDLFLEFETCPTASASIAQVHFAKIKNGKLAKQAVAIKVLRPGILKTIKKDLKILKQIAKLLERYSSNAKRLRPVEVVAEFEKYLHDELDFLREAANASQLRRNFSNRNLILIPEIYWEYCTSNVLVMEKMDGIPINQINALQTAKINLSKLAKEGVEIFFTQVFIDGFFHADMHPGNILISQSIENWGKYVALDFGIVGSLSDFDKNYLAQNFLAFFNRDYRRVATLHIESGWAPQNTRVEELESAVRSVCEPYFDKVLKDISLAQVLLKLFQASRRFNINIQPQLVLLQKTLFNIEGLGRQLDPNLDLWTTAKPFLEHCMKKQMGLRGWIEHLQSEIPQWSKTLPEIPRLFHHALLNMNVPQKNHQENLIKLVYQQQKKTNRLHKIFILVSTISILISLYLSYTSIDIEFPLLKIFH